MMIQRLKHILFVVAFRYLFIYSTIIIILLHIVPSKAVAYDIVAMTSGNLKLYSDVLEGFKQKCPRCNLTVYNVTENADKTLADISTMSPDALLAIGTKAYISLKQLKNVPLITVLSYPYESPHGSNVWWLSTEISPGLYISRLIALFPRIKKIGVIMDPLLSQHYTDALSKAAATKGIVIITKAISSVEQVPQVLQTLIGKIDLLVMLPDTTVSAQESRMALAGFSEQYRIPLVTFSHRYLEDGALVSIEIDPVDLGTQAGEIAQTALGYNHTVPDKIYYARKSSIYINSKVADKLGITFSKRSFRGEP